MNTQESLLNILKQRSVVTYTIVGVICLKLLRCLNFLKLLLLIFIIFKTNEEYKNGYKIEHLGG